MITICKACGMTESMITDSKWGATGCTECCSIEQGFLCVQDWDYKGVTYSVDEDGFVYDIENELEGPIACII